MADSSGSAHGAVQVGAGSAVSTNQVRRNKDGLGALLTEFFACLLKSLWITLLSIVKSFAPVPKKDVRKEIVLVTGAGSGIGRLMSLRFAELGATVVLLDVNTESNKAVYEEITNKGQVAHAYTCDLSDKDAIYQTAAKVQRDVGSVTVLINNAGIASGRKLFDTPDEMIDLTFRVNTIAHFWTIKAFLPDMISMNHGHIITIASGAGHFGIAGLVDYCSSKFGAVGTHLSLSQELATIGCTGVHTTCVCPYFIDTGMFDGVKTRIPWLLPILKPDYAVGKIMDAFHSNQNMLMMPKILYLFLILQALLPFRATLLLAEFSGVTYAMDTYRGRQKKE